MFDQVANFARTKVTAAIASGDATISVTDASVFPDPSSPPAGLNGEFNIVLWDGDGEFPRPDQDPDVEIVRVTSVDTANDTLTVQRGQEDTTTASHPDTAVAAQTYTRRLTQAPMARLMSASQSEFETLIEDAAIADGMVASPVVMGSISASKPAMDAVIASQTALDAVTASQTAMDAVIASQTAMDAVIASQTADQIYHNSNLYGDALASVGATGASGVGDVDAVAASQTAMDSVAASQTAMDAVVASQTALDAVIASQTAMDAVSKSSTAMDAVSTSILARTAILSSSYTIEDVWKRDMPSDTLLKEFSPTPPNTFLNGATSRIVANQYSSGKAMQLSRSDGDAIARNDETITLDFTNISTLQVTTDHQRNYSGMDIVISVGSNDLYRSDSTHSWTQRSFDVSTYSGEMDLKLSIQANDSNRVCTSKFSEIKLTA